MKKLLLILALTSINFLAFSQVTVKTEFKTKVDCSQKGGFSSEAGEFLLNVTYDDITIKFNTREGQRMTPYTIAKKTNEYVIGKDDSGNYSFYNIKKQQFFYIHYYSSQYHTAGYGIGYSENKQTIIKMMDLLKEGKTQKDVIQHLITQTEYDF
tara:strand:+ start:2386 stop:2847 length:462 start_codon:yes stop_codon:yes gene_type:complete